MAGNDMSCFLDQDRKQVASNIGDQVDRAGDQKLQACALAAVREWNKRLRYCAA